MPRPTKAKDPVAGTGDQGRPEGRERESGIAPDAWAIHYGNDCKHVVWDYTKALNDAARFHGTIHPMAYLDGKV